MSISTELVVIGGGPGGYPAAFYAADLGMKVTIIELEENPGGVCLYRGCIPSKALLHIAKLMGEVEEAEAMGLVYNKPKLNIDKVREWKESVVQRMTGGLGQMRKLRGVDYVLGRATFKDANTLTITKENGDTEELSFEKAIIATGSHPTVIPVFDLGSDRILDSTTALALEDVPKSLMVLGGGYIGLEMGTVYDALGSDVTVVEMMPQLIPGADKDLIAPLAKRLKSKFKAILTNTKVVKMEEVKAGIKVSMETAKGEKIDQTFEKVLISVGRKPNSANLGLENTQIEIDDKGFIKSDASRRTAESHICVIGDVAGEPMLAHKATHEGIVAVEVLDGKKTVFDPHAIPAVVFTDPEVAWTGITENEAKERGLNYKVAKFPWGASGRATTLERNDGLTKLIVDDDTKRVLGVGITGVGAGDMIAEGTLAIEMGATVEDIKLTIHPHPTLSETVMEAAEVFYGHSPHFYQKK